MPRIPSRSIGAISLLLLAGCGRPPQLESKENFEVAMQLSIAIAGKRTELVDQCVQLLDQRHAAGELSDAAHAALLAIADQAKSGQWDEARAAIVAFQKGQKPATEP